MKIIVIAPPVCRESGRKLAKLLDCKFTDVDYIAQQKQNTLIFNYGMGYLKNGKNAIINSVDAINTCCDKLETLRCFTRSGVKTLEYTPSRKLAKSWFQKDDVVVVRKQLDGKANAGLIVAENEEEIVAAPLYTRYYFHKKEYRVTVFRGVVAGIYEKVEIDGSWHLLHENKRPCHKKMIWDALKAAKELEIDYVGFDVLYNSANDYKFIEANSGPILTPEVGDYIKRQLKD